AEIWAVANVLAPIMLIEALVLPNNGLLPLGGIIAMGLTPALLVVTRGKIIRMIVIGTVLLPTFLYSGTLIAPFVTETAKQVGAFPADVATNALISHSTLEGPIEKFVAYFIGQASQGDIEMILYAALAVAIYLVLFIWYAKEMKKRNAEYAKKKA
ncbi:MAG: PTS glucitol transporter subunit IIA, partial [Aerococcus urinaeequi]